MPRELTPDDYTARCWECKQLRVEKAVKAGLNCEECFSKWLRRSDDPERDAKLRHQHFPPVGETQDDGN